MENPVVVFVLGDKCSAPNLVFPTGWTKEGKRLDGAAAIRGNNCCVILLADDQVIPLCEHANKDVSQQLPVITHENSSLYTADTIASTGLACWGTPVWRDSFSHITDAADGTFKEILELLSDPSGAKSFAQQRQMANDLDVLDQLAAICQICMIDPHANTDSWWRLFNKLPACEFKNQLRAAQKNGWSVALGVIAARANTLSSQSPA